MDPSKPYRFTTAQEPRRDTDGHTRSSYQLVRVADGRTVATVHIKDRQIESFTSGSEDDYCRATFMAMAVEHHRKFKL